MTQIDAMTELIWSRIGLPTKAIASRLKNVMFKKEKNLQARIEKHARDFGYSKPFGFFYHTYRSVKSEQGFPDIVMSNGRHLVIAEVKLNSGKVSPHQAQMLNIFADLLPAHTFLWREEHLPEIYELLSGVSAFNGEQESLWIYTDAYANWHERKFDDRSRWVDFTKIMDAKPPDAVRMRLANIGADFLTAALNKEDESEQ
jgi:hypothetical protein